MGSASSKATNDETFEKIQQNPFQMIKLKQEEEKLKQEEAKSKLLAAETEAKSKVLAAETEAKSKVLAEEAEQAKERTKLLAAEVTKAKAIAKQEEEKIPQIAEESKVKLQQLNQEIINSKAESEAKTINPWFTVFGVGGIMLVGLGIDYMRHTSPTFIRSRIKATILKNQPPPTLKEEPTKYFPTGQSPLIPLRKPTILFGPTGCGKSTLMARIARDHFTGKLESITPPKQSNVSEHPIGNDENKASNVTPAPVVFITIRDSASYKTNKKRLPKSDTQASTKVKDETGAQPITEDEPSPASAKNHMNVVASQVFKQIGFPNREPLIVALKNIDIKGFINSNPVEVNVGIDWQKINRFKFALICLFEACAEITRERLATGNYSVRDAATVILLDEIHDLIKSNQLEAYGGREIFEELMNLLVTYGVNADKVRAVIAGSSGQVITESKKSNLRGRFKPYFLEDPSIADITKELKVKGYDDAECSKIISVCGTRLRILEEFLEQKIDVEKHLSLLIGNVKQDFRNFFRNIRDDKDTMRVVKIFDDLLKGDSNIQITELPVSTLKLDVSSLFFVLNDDTLRFQSQLVLSVWPTIRNEFIKNPELK